MSIGTIVLDPGHGQYGNRHFPCENYEGDFFEGTQNFVLASYLKAELEKRNFEVIMTRKNVWDDPSLSERGETAGKNNAILFLSIHSNAPGPASDKDAYHSVRGAVTYYSLADEEDVLFFMALNREVSKVMNTPDRGIKTREYPDKPGVDYYGVIRASVASGCRRAALIEHGFHTNPEDALFLQSDDCLKRLAAAEAEVIDRFLGVGSCI